MEENKNDQPQNNVSVSVPVPIPVPVPVPIRKRLHPNIVSTEQVNPWTCRVAFKTRQSSKLNSACVTASGSGAGADVGSAPAVKTITLNHAPYETPRTAGRGPSSIKLTSTWSIKQHVPPVYDQGNLGSCVSNAECAALSTLFRISRGRHIAASRLFMYFNARAIDANLGLLDHSDLVEDTGLYTGDGFLSTATYGYVLETAHPYDISKFDLLPSRQVYKNALSRTVVVQYEFVPKNLNTIKSWLRLNKPVVFGFDVYDSFYSDSTTNTGVVNLPEDDDTFLGGHEVMLVGYNDSTSRFEFMNSWGTDWGNNGFGTIPYEYVVGTHGGDLAVLKNFSG